MYQYRSQTFRALGETGSFRSLSATLQRYEQRRCLVERSPSIARVKELRLSLNESCGLWACGALWR